MVDDVQIDDCWNRIGVWSRADTRCPRLQEVVHCRNCDVYSTAARTLLDREMPDQTRQEWTSNYARPALPSRQPGKSFTLFRIGAEWLAIPTRTIRNIGDVVPVRRIPHRNNPVLRGLANLSGELELVVSLKAVLGIDSTAEVGEQRKGARRAIARMVRVNWETGPFAFEADEVLGTHRHEESKMDTVPSTLENALQRYVSGTMEAEGRRIGVLDLGLIAYSVEQSLK